ncbi:hypothetical protein BDN72DRAFT_845601 [Pluteus cervinus]|uniref:Uncharacterized protein n=1 Tax=Pluteus cervinus TaxID=181527 RepID=A0ACD3AI43_9AGAR|nr:hypothetical protein BDN72DRAFT_845601 [Pluteus cervinus]
MTATENDHTVWKKGSSITWTSHSGGKGFGVTYVPSESVLEDFFKEEFETK